MPQTEEDRRAIMNIKKFFPILIVAFASIGTWALLNARPEVATASVAGIPRVDVVN